MPQGPAGSLEAVRPSGVVTWLEITQAPGRPVAVFVVRIRCPSLVPPVTASDARLSAEVVRTGGMRWGRTQMGKAMMTAVKMARVTAIAGRVRRIKSQAVTPRANTSAAYTAGATPE